MLSYKSRTKLIKFNNFIEVINLPFLQNLNKNIYITVAHTLKNVDK